jgi:Ca2+-transporting ATPase
MIGDPTEGALVTLAAKAGLRQTEVTQAWPRLAEIPFDSERKRMTTIHRSPDGSGLCHAYTKGAPELVLEHCTHYLQAGEVLPLTQAKRAEILHVNSSLAGQALRVLSVAYRTLEEVPAEPQPDQVEQDLIFVGLTAMRDPRAA